VELSEREQVVFNMLQQNGMVSTVDIVRTLRLSGKHDMHTVNVMMKYLTAKACQEGWIISMVEGGRGAGNIAVYRMEKRF
jgi:hypothetical protein